MGFIQHPPDEYEARPAVIAGPGVQPNDIINRKLVVNVQEAEQVRHTYERYLALGCVRELKQELTAQGYVSKIRTSTKGNVTGGKPFSRGALYALLQNPTYIGDIRHKDKRYPGEHEGLVDREIWDQVQSLLNRNRVERKTGQNSTETSLLAGLLFDEHGRRLTPSHSRKGERRYRYYVTQDNSDSALRPVRIPANDIEKIVSTEIARFVEDDSRILDTLDLPEDDLNSRRFILDQICQKKLVFTEGSAGEQKIVLGDILERIELRKASIKLCISPSRLRGWLTGDQSETVLDDMVELIVGVALKRRGGETKLVISPQMGEIELSPDQALIKAVAKACRWNKILLMAETPSIRALAKAEGVTHGYIRKLLPLAHLAPSIVTDIMEGKQPIDLTLKQLIATTLPICWVAQRDLLGFSKL